MTLGLYANGIFYPGTLIDGKLVLCLPQDMKPLLHVVTYDAKKILNREGYENKRGD